MANGSIAVYQFKKGPDGMLAELPAIFQGLRILHMVWYDSDKFHSHRDGRLLNAALGALQEVSDILNNEKYLTIEGVPEVRVLDGDGN
jgi:hypothetical protein